MALLFHWVRKNYYADRSAGFEYNLNQDSPAMLKARPNDIIWAFTRRKDDVYVVAVRGIIQKSTENEPGFHYGAHRVWLDPKQTVYFDVDEGLDVEPVIRSLSVKTKAEVLGESFQGRAGVREITQEDNERLEEFVKQLCPTAV